MLSILNLASWCALAGLALQFLYVGRRLQSDRSYAAYAAALAMASPAFLPAAWMGAWPGIPVSGSGLAWVKAGGLAFLALLPLWLAFLSEACRTVPPGAFRLLAAVCAAAGILLAYDLAAAGASPLPMLVAGPRGPVFASLPAALLPGAALVIFLVLQASALAAFVAAARGAERPRAFLLAAGCAAACLGTLADLAAPALGYPGGYALPGWALAAASGAFLLLSRCLEIEKENRAALDRLAGAYALLRENAGLRELGTSAAMISHEIRNYVSALKGNAVLLVEGGAKVAALQEATERLDVITRDIAEFSSLSRSAPRVQREVRLEDLLRDCVARHFASDAERFSVVPPARPATVRGDAAGLEQAFINLLRNALEAGARRVEVRFLSFGDRLVAAVEDDGSGCAAEDLPRIGTPFYTGKGDRGGTGLGCAVASSILGAHGATLRAYSKNAVGEGRSGLVVNAVFPHPGSRPSGADFPACEIVVAAEDAAVRACVLPPLLNLGVRPILLSGALLEARLPDGFRSPLLLVEEAWAPRLLPAWRRGPAFIADGRRVMWRAPSEPASRRQLLSEEGLAALITAGALP